MPTTAERRQTKAEMIARDSLGDFLRGLRSYWWLVVLVVVAAAAGSIAYTRRLPKVYQAAATVEFDPSPVHPLGDIEDIGSPVSNFWLSREFFATQEKVIASRAIAERVVLRLGLHRMRDFASHVDSYPPDWDGMELRQASEILLARLSVVDVRGTRLVSLVVQDHDPERASLIANTIADVYIEKTLEDRAGTSRNAVEWLGEQLDTLRSQLEQSELALHQFKREHNVLSVSLEDRRNLVVREIEEFTGSLTDARRHRIEQQAKLARLRSLLVIEDAAVQAAALGQVAGGRLADVTRDLATKTRERLAMQEQYGPNYPAMQQLTRQIDALREELRQEIEGMAQAAEADVREATAVESGIRQALSHAQQQGLELNMREIEYQRLSRERDNNEKLYQTVLERTAEADIARMLRTTFVRIVDRALPPRVGAYVSPNILFITGSAVALAFALSLALVFLLARMDNRLRSAEEVEEMGATVLGVLPKMPGERDRRAARRGKELASSANDLLAHTQPLSAVAENFRTIRTNLVFMGGERELRTLAITSANPAEGKTMLAANMAISLAQSGKKILLVDTDLRRPRLHRAFEVRSGKGVSGILTGQATLDEAIKTTSVPNVDLLPSGPIPPNPTELLHRDAFRTLLEDASERYDMILCDSPPLSAVIDAAVLAPQLEGVIIVARPGETSRFALRQMLRQLNDVGANLVGAIVNGVDPRRKGYYGGYHYYYRRDNAYFSPESDQEGSNEESDSKTEV